MNSRLLPCSYNSVLCSYAVDGPVFYAQCDDATTLPSFHQQVQGKVLHKVAGIIPQRLEGRDKGPRFPRQAGCEAHTHSNTVRANRLKTLIR